MKTSWFDFAKQLTLPSSLAGEIWQQIEQYHSEPHRAYHNLTHLSSMFGVLPQLVEGDIPTAVSLAVWFHDIIYDPKSGTNEEDSAKMLQMWLGDKVNAALVDEAVRLILLTKGHQLSNDEDQNGRFLLDADLSILGRDWEAYQAYAAAIRSEYAHVPDEYYRQGRAAVLNHFLGMASIYLTEYGREHWEAQARENISNELAQIML